MGVPQQKSLNVDRHTAVLSSLHCLLLYLSLLDREYLALHRKIICIIRSWLIVVSLLHLKVWELPPSPPRSFQSIPAGARSFRSASASSGFTARSSLPNSKLTNASTDRF